MYPFGRLVQSLTYLKIMEDDLRSKYHAAMSYYLYQDLSTQSEKNWREFYWTDRFCLISNRMSDCTFNSVRETRGISQGFQTVVVGITTLARGQLKSLQYGSTLQPYHAVGTLICATIFPWCLLPIYVSRERHP